MLKLTAHAARMIEARGIDLAWVEAAVAKPDRHGPDPANAALTRSFLAIAAAGGRVLRVVHRPDGADVVVITAFLDRGARP